MMPPLSPRRLWPILVLAALAFPSRGYVDMTPTLGRVIGESRSISVIEVEKVSREKMAIVYKRVGDLWRNLGTDVVRHQLTSGDPPRPPRHLIDWARPGRQAIFFNSGRGGYVCTGDAWYRVAPVAAGDGTEEWSRMTLDCPEMALCYRGSTRRLAKAVTEIVQGREVVITTVAHGAQGRGAFSDVVFDTLQSGPPAPLQRLRASLRMPPIIIAMGSRPPWFVGLGAVVEEDMPRLLEELKSSDRWERLDALDDLGLLGPGAKTALPAVRPLLEDTDPLVRLHAAATLLAIEPDAQGAVAGLTAGLADASADVRVEACRCLGRMGPKAQAAAPELIRLVGQQGDDDSRAAAITALGAIGPTASGAVGTLSKCLAEPAVRCYAAEALGRIGPASAATLPLLARMLDDADRDVQWSAVKAMVQIGGEGARPVVPFLIRRTEAAPRGRELYQLTWLLGLLGPVAKDALPVLREAQNRDNELAAMAIWAIAPEDQFPWQIGYRADRDCDLWLFADYIQRMGPARTKGSALALVDGILHNRAGPVPSWGYYLLSARAEVTVPALVEALENAPASQKRWAAWTLGHMGATAAPAKPALQAASGSQDGFLAEAAKAALREIGEGGK